VAGVVSRKEFDRKLREYNYDKSRMIGWLKILADAALDLCRQARAKEIAERPTKQEIIKALDSLYPTEHRERICACVGIYCIDHNCPTWKEQLAQAIHERLKGKNE
jgi:hypothetical protein